MGTELVAHEEEDRYGAIQLLLRLEAEGKADAVSLTLTDPDLPYNTWEDLGRFLGSIDRRSRWYIGDWLNFGELVYGEEASQAIEATTRERYDQAERVTGLDHGTLMNIRSVCGRIARDRRSESLGFWIHAEVAALEPAEQEVWLGKAVERSWTRAELRDAIRTEKRPSTADPDPDPGTVVVEGLSVGERVEAAARLVWTQAQPTIDGSFLVPAEPMVQLKSALGAE